ncbi:hypothetical protein BCR33DRAFT_724244 [Rhizoclosmatium globosum]|uniref:Uncharacterized protein n=1 Tax=Rhizoclosmatium globosum TaxID=329046 RepID=A0A1Y2B787_9FUNG|nr:hypothetical protein BCR33DRAFT_724244 [Rhizoclosmatium globosum]|eukprot:ORY30701.1 hypothetical protein BCR33DRAFT_724244 [Rhizoclosmatium globosum]
MELALLILQLILFECEYLKLLKAAYCGWNLTSQLIAPQRKKIQLDTQPNLIRNTSTQLIMMQRQNPQFHQIPYFLWYVPAELIMRQR